MIGFSADLDRVRINERGMYAVLTSQRGPVARHIRAVGRRTVIKAKALAGVKTGALKRSIKMRRDRTYRGEYAVLVGSDVSHALVHHEGARPHIITPQQPGGVLVFRGKRGKVVTKMVRHPGHRPNPYLTLALRRSISR
jgi:hypothetical protein